jgi:hypothetical protein
MMGIAPFHGLMAWLMHYSSTAEGVPISLISNYPKKIEGGHFEIVVVVVASNY